MSAGQFGDERWVSLPLDLDLDFDADEPEPLPFRVPLYRRVYERWWGRPWPVYRSTELDPEIPTLPDIAEWKG